MSEKYYPISPYAYCLNNPVKYIDPNGMDVYLTGEAAQEAFRQLQMQMNNKINLSINEQGQLSYTLEEGQKLKGNAKRMAKMIDNQLITVHILTTNGYTTSTGEPFIGGVFMGNTVTKDEKGNVTHVDAYQEVNPRLLGDADIITETPGKMMMHEATEAYEGAKISKKEGVGVGPATRADQADPKSVYSRAHDMATPQTPLLKQMYDIKGYYTKDETKARSVNIYVNKISKSTLIRTLTIR